MTSQQLQHVDTPFCFKFTIDYLKPNIFSKLRIKNIENQLFELMHINMECSLDQATKQMIDQTNNNCYNHLINNLISRNKELINIKTDMNQTNMNQFDLDKQNLKYFIIKKINYFVKNYNKTLKEIESNNDLGNRILKNLENLKATPLELDKYKLLVNESDVINNLLLKLCNKLANTENSIQIISLKQMQNITNNNFMQTSDLLNSNTSNETNEEIVCIFIIF